MRQDVRRSGGRSIQGRRSLQVAPGRVCGADRGCGRARVCEPGSGPEDAGRLWDGHILVCLRKHPLSAHVPGLPGDFGLWNQPSGRSEHSQRKGLPDDGKRSDRVLRRSAGRGHRDRGLSGSGRTHGRGSELCPEPEGRDCNHHPRHDHQRRHEGRAEDHQQAAEGRAEDPGQAVLG